MPERILLHIGTQKTGSTSLQHFLHDHRASLLAPAGADYPPGLVLAASHSELPLLAMRAERLSPARLRLPETRQARWLAHADAHVRAQVREARAGTLVYSHEDLSYLRHDDEVERLGDLFGDVEVRVVVFLREAQAFLRSYRSQLDAMGFAPSLDPASFSYVEPDSWLVDHQSLLRTYRRRFGESNVEALDYDATMRTDGSVIPVVADRLGIERSSLPAVDRYQLNRSGVHPRPSEAQLAGLRRRLEEQAR